MITAKGQLFLMFDDDGQGTIADVSSTHAHDRNAPTLKQIPGADLDTPTVLISSRAMAAN